MGFLVCWWNLLLVDGSPSSGGNSGLRSLQHGDLDCPPSLYRPPLQRIRGSLSGPSVVRAAWGPPTWDRILRRWAPPTITPLNVRILVGIERVLYLSQSGCQVFPGCRPLVHALTLTASASDNSFSILGPPGRETPCALRPPSDRQQKSTGFPVEWWALASTEVPPRNSPFYRRSVWSSHGQRMCHANVDLRWA
jgi:hypothetical protein